MNIIGSTVLRWIMTLVLNHEVHNLITIKDIGLRDFISPNCIIFTKEGVYRQVTFIKPTLKWKGVRHEVLNLEIE